MTTSTLTTRTRLDRASTFGREHLLSILVASLLIGQALFMSFALSTTWFVGDDFTYLTAVTSGEGMVHWLTTPYTGHLLPGTFLTTWLLQLPAPMEWFWFAAALVAMQFLASLLTWKVLRAILGDSPFTLLLFVIYITSVLTFSAVMWWAAAIEYLPVLIGLPATILLFRRAIMRAGRFTFLLPALSLAVTLFFFEKALLVGAFVVLLWLLIPIMPDAEHTARGRLRQGAKPIIGLVTVSVVHFLIYLALTAGSAQRPEVSLGVLTHLRFDIATSVLLPALVGGPHHFNLILVAPNQFETVLALVALGAAVLWSAIARRIWIRFWVALFALITIDVTVLTASGRRFLEAPRYVSDLLLPMLLLIGLAVIGSRFDTSGGKPHHVRLFEGQRWRSVAVGAIYIACAALWISGFSNLVGARARFADDRAESYVDAARASIAHHTEAIEIFARPAPPAVFPSGWVSSKNLDQTLLSPLSPDLHFVSRSSSPHLVLPDGTIAPATITRSYDAAIPESRCVELTHDPEPISLELNRSGFEWRWFGSITVESRTAGGLTIAWGLDPVHVDFPAGLSTTYFPITGVGRSIRLVADQGTSDACVSRLEFGDLIPAAG